MRFAGVFAGVARKTHDDGSGLHDHACPLGDIDKGKPDWKGAFIDVLRRKQRRTG
ncbi:hypothetical protein [Janthinobacterium sp. 13]|uniref:hypothetical protein n=1 Tax=Janthinobacterium sp. 13 TaxID=2035211 RepID=UPI0015D4992D|nr:hypothetical protein [Janthinobacterium sp. 13]